MMDPSQQDLHTVATVASEFEAQTLVVVLEEAGIPARAFASVRQSLPLGTKFTGVPVQVRRCDVERARSELSRRRAESSEIDWDEVDLGVRDDELPLSRADGMSIMAKIGFVVAIVVVSMMAALAVLLVVIG